MLRLADVPELIADERQEYVATAVDIARNAARRRDLSQRLLQGGANIFDRAEPLTALGRQLEAMACD
jgi:predicted O-linked N-acetylglucosamine transferase (SPINDLY family)